MVHSKNLLMEKLLQLSLFAAVATKYDYLSTLSHDYDDDVLMYLKVNGFCSKWLYKKIHSMILGKPLSSSKFLLQKEPQGYKNSIKRHTNVIFFSKLVLSSVI